MSDLTPEQIKAHILRGLRRVARRFDEDPTPTDGSFQAAVEKMGVRSNVRVPTTDRKRVKPGNAA